MAVVKKPLRAKGFAALQQNFKKQFTDVFPDRLADKGVYITASGNTRYYFASDNVSNEKYKGLTPHDLIDIAMQHGLMYDGATQRGVMFHLMGALSEHGKLGLVCIGSSRENAFAYYKKVIEVLDTECA